ncbi:hypothetical protein [Tatumella terrea]|uniref:hypothetical protein n=1 Tax=Tatumella terrea TaxID=419007 RepID=UPI0031E2C89D
MTRANVDHSRMPPCCRNQATRKSHTEIPESIHRFIPSADNKAIPYDDPNSDDRSENTSGTRGEGSLISDTR